MCCIAELYVDLNAIKCNIDRLKQLLNNNQKLCFIAKANCYGLGDEKICKFLNGCVDYFAVSCESEFLRIKKHVTKPILILNPIYKNITKLAWLNAEFCCSNFESLNAILKCAEKNKNINFKIHIAVNTGMNRLGFSEKEDVFKVINILEKTQNISIIGVFTHYYHANNKNIAEMQFLKFAELKEKINYNFPNNQLIFHLASSYGVIFKNGFDMARVGYLAYEDSVFSTIKLCAKIIDLQVLQTGDTAGYEGVFVATKETKIAILQIGYADGIFRNIVNNGYVLINNNFAKIVAICMDSMLVDVSKISCKIGDDAVLIGKDKTKQIFICDVAGWCDTIGYEIISKLSFRINRKYLR